MNYLPGKSGSNWLQLTSVQAATPSKHKTFDLGMQFDSHRDQVRDVLGNYLTADYARSLRKTLHKQVIVADAKCFNPLIQ